MLTRLRSYTNRLKHDQSSYAAKLSYTSDHKGLSQTLQCFDRRSMRSAHFDIFPSVKAEETCRRTKQDGLLPVELVQISCFIHFTSSTARSDFFYTGTMVLPRANHGDDCGNGSHYSSRQSIINQTETAAYLSFWTATEHVFLQKHRPYA